jgi:Zn-finger nucleic acid-binding protein
MKCPVCETKLSRIQYEGLNIRECESCRGTLLKFNRLKAIETRRQHSEEELLEQVSTEGEDTLSKINCPECFRTMDKRKKKVGPWEFAVDRCQKCRYVWLDAGELAKMQIIFEFSDQGEEAERFKQRLTNMSPEDKAALDERIANLPEENITREIIFDVLTTRRRSRRWHSFWFPWF